MILSLVVSKGKRTLNDATISHIKGPTTSEREEIMSNFEAAEYYSMLASAISGGVESPIQFVTQVSKSSIFKKYQRCCIHKANFYIAPLNAFNLLILDVVDSDRKIRLSLGTKLVSV